ncbi:membrane integrity-associated transporter subunit PqiC [Pseudoruegeria sp. SK021]|uniref:PqiC family protein n=1 Tax=Pseudoruegeria sp. SK021 TaxID=1933035 RepID=UPI00143D4D36|nr:PqiC family protein [Pseudoruegeria sp. SK021]
MSRAFFGTALLLICGTLAGCASKPSNFYILSAPGAETAQAVQTTRMAGPSIGIGPITLPEYLDRSEIVTRNSETTLEVHEMNQWGGNLTENVQSVLAEVLSDGMNTDRLFLYPWSTSGQMTYQVLVQINAFEAREDGNVVLDARWTVLSGRTQDVLKMGRTLLREPIGATPNGVAGPDYADIAAAMSRSVARLGQEIAATGLLR